MKTLLALALTGLAVLVSTWGLMVVVGIVHAIWIPALPTIGWGAALNITAVAVAFTAAASFLSGLVSALVSDR